MNLIQALIFGIVEGITEFLPISSTGHLMLTARVMGLTQTEFLKTFEIVIQFGAILSVIVLYWRSILLNLNILKRVIIAFIPTAVLGLVFYKIIKQFLMKSEQVVLWSMFIGGICLIVFEFIHREKDDAIEDIGLIPYGTLLIIGLFQSIAMVPGVSRSAATIIGGLILGLRRKTIVEFSFLLAIPTMLAATTLDLYKNIGQFSISQINFLSAGFVFSFIFALLSVKFLLNFIKQHTFISFGVYRIILALVFWFLVK
ncbi:MAG TPA: undecaprenyl-diphosphate phosphatase [Syntrophorhabdaceae bacterium]|nr:undecaprenyl-diphosphate phosphatase [Syntrophorhabdaceae bacterium]HOL05232.1 undecaprenyl-diphosphate phosphatase [Syntrophorhabdaceae bacterium]HON84815.1 undecaprenyl-diphosphate phosphatase [Syntrophorhabdaceae bacterium]HOT41924.1 undecaprenyl-diphosphate phosphatase [Syntrophorhabdaceae bacterium]HPC66393.1 undecaprenyl-diphosphate phosphatase [Syntrophorhabdaceae bacterium]